MTTFFKLRFRYFVHTWLFFACMLIFYVIEYGFDFAQKEKEFGMIEFGLFVSLFIWIPQLLMGIPYYIKRLTYGSKLRTQMKESCHLNHTVLITKDYFIYYGMYRKVFLNINEIQEGSLNFSTVSTTGRGAVTMSVSQLSLQLTNGKVINLDLNFSMFSQEAEEVRSALRCACQGSRIPQKSETKLNDSSVGTIPDKAFPDHALLILGISLAIAFATRGLPLLVHKVCGSSSEDVQFLFYHGYYSFFLAGYYVICFSMLLYILWRISKKVIFYMNSLYMTLNLLILIGCVLIAFMGWPTFDGKTSKAFRQDYKVFKSEEGLPALPVIQDDSRCRDEVIQHYIDRIGKYTYNEDYYYSPETKEYFWTIVRNGESTPMEEFHYYCPNTHMLMRESCEKGQ